MKKALIYALYTVVIARYNNHIERIVSLGNQLQLREVYRGSLGAVGFERTRKTEDNLDISNVQRLAAGKTETALRRPRKREIHLLCLLA